MKSLYYVLFKKQFASNKSGEHKEYYVISIIACNDKVLTGQKSYDKWVTKEQYQTVSANAIYEMLFDLDGKIKVIRKYRGKVKELKGTDFTKNEKYTIAKLFDYMDQQNKKEQAQEAVKP